LRWLQKAVEQHGAPEFLRSDNGSSTQREIARLLADFLHDN